MSELTTRAIFGAIYALVVLTGIWFHPYGLLALIIFIYVAGITEMKHLLHASEHKNLYLTATLIGVFTLGTHLIFSSDGQNYLLFYLLFGLVVLFLQHLFSKGSEANLDRLPRVVFALLYLLIPTSLAISISFLDSSWEPRYMLAIFFILWANDTFAYLTGIKFGKHKLIPRLSPKKSIEGLLGGIIGSLLVGYVLSLFWTLLSLPQWIIFAAIVSAAGTVGDLFESSLKRSAGIKDSGNLIPGHGGVLDRLDSFLIAVPFVYFYLFFFT